ncbi:MAG TPA: hypothetical protein VNW06_00635 [Cytophagaceae bacterium]|nr:hypothetical protein [Cytophagaceae bacterium]
MFNRVYQKKVKEFESYIDPGSPAYHDTDYLFYRWYKRGSLIYCTEETILNKLFLEDLNKGYPNMEVLYSFQEGAVGSPAIVNHQKQFFLIRIKHGLLLEFNSIRTYRIYYLKKYKETELKIIIKLMTKSKMEGWISNYRNTFLN